MQGRTLYLTAAIAAATTVGLLAFNGYAEKKGGGIRAQVGPDVVSWTIAGENSFDMGYYGSSGNISGFAIATQSCNWGDLVADWISGTNQVPVIAQNGFRYKDGRFEQIAMSWLKHAFCAVSEPGCGTCQATGCSSLGIGCADTYWAGLNANGQAPRSDVNAFTGFYNYPFTVSSSGPGSIRGNLQFAHADIDPALNPNARYFVEAQYVTADDAQWGNQMNNASWREIGFSSVSSPFPMSSDGTAETQVGEPAILAWAQIEPGVTVRQVITPGDGKVLVGAHATDNGNGTYTYEYAIHNLNCDRSIGQVSIPTGSSTITNVGFHDVDYHSGEIFDGTDWSNTVVPGTVSWSTQSFVQNPNANALRWGTLYNFRFVSTAPPVAGNIELSFFKPGEVASFSVATTIPGGVPIDPCDSPVGPCAEDVDGNSIIAVGDILGLIAHFGECGDGTYRPVGDVNGDCCVTIADLLDIIAAWGNDCSPISACCLPQGGCSELTAANCSASGGVYQGDGATCATSNCPELGACCFIDGTCSELMATDCIAAAGGFQGDATLCANVSCPVAGAGDEFTGAFVAVTGANPFETVSATPSQPQPVENQCTGTYLSWGNGNDVWFRWTAASSGVVRFSTCDNTSYDTSMVLYEDSGTNQVACNGDSSNGESGCQAFYASIDFNVTAGHTYYIRLGGYNGMIGAGTLTIN